MICKNCLFEDIEKIKNKIVTEDKCIGADHRKNNFLAQKCAPSFVF